MKRIYLTLILGIFLLSLASAYISLEEPGLKDDCFQITQTCSNCTEVFLTKVVDPNSTIYHFNSLMTKNWTEYNYSFCNTSLSGKYYFSVLGDKNGVNKTENGEFTVNPTGISSSSSRTDAVSRSIYFTLILGILFFTGFLFVKNKPPIKWTFFIFGLFFFLVTLNILFVGLQDEVVNPRIEGFFDSFTAISFYIYWFLAGVLAIMWFLTFLQTWLLNKNQRAMAKYGAY